MSDMRFILDVAAVLLGGILIGLKIGTHLSCRKCQISINASKHQTAAEVLASAERAFQICRAKR